MGSDKQKIQGHQAWLVPGGGLTGVARSLPVLALLLSVSASFPSRLPFVEARWLPAAPGPCPASLTPWQRVSFQDRSSQLPLYYKTSENDNHQQRTLFEHLLPDKGILRLLTLSLLTDSSSKGD